MYAGAIVGRVDVVVVVEVCNGKVSVKSLYTLLHSKEWLFYAYVCRTYKGFLQYTAARNIINMQRGISYQLPLQPQPTTESPTFIHNTTTNYIEGKIPTVMPCHNFRPTAVIMSHIMTQHRSSYTKS